jgi:hypothetical protein
VYSLGVALRSLLGDAPADDVRRDLVACIDSCTKPSGAKRPTTSDLVATLERLDAKAQVSAEAQRVVSTLRTNLEAAKADATFVDVVSKFEGTVTAVGLGYHPHLLMRCTNAADFLNQLIEAHEPQSSLGFIQRGGRFDALYKGDLASCRDYVRVLRNRRSHGSKDAKTEGDDQRYAAFASQRPDQQRTTVLTFAAAVGKAIGQNMTKTVAEALLGP